MSVDEVEALELSRLTKPRWPWNKDGRVLYRKLTQSPPYQEAPTGSKTLTSSKQAHGICVWFARGQRWPDAPCRAGLPSSLSRGVLAMPKSQR